MTARTLHFYFDYLSPYAYFSWRALQPLCQRYQLQLIPHPVVFGKLLDHWGQLGPAEVVPKKAALYRYCYRYAALNGFEFNPPHCHPFNPLPALRLSLAEVSGDKQTALISAIFDAGWSQGADLSCVETLGKLAHNTGLGSATVLDSITRQDTKDLLHRETEQAIAQGVFGVPTFMIDDELFWGHDQLAHIELYLQGKDPLDPDKVDRMLNRARGIDRKAVRDSQ